MQHSPSVKDHHSESYIIILQLLSTESHDSTLNHQKRKNKLVLMNVSLRPLIVLINHKTSYTKWTDRVYRSLQSLHST